MITSNLKKKGVVFIYASRGTEFIMAGKGMVGGEETEIVHYIPI